VRVDSTTGADSAGVFRCMCDCLKQFTNIQGMNSHKRTCDAAIAAKREDDEQFDEQISTVFVCGEDGDL